MRRNRFLLLATLSATLALAARSDAQAGRLQRRSPRAYLVLSDGIGVSSGGLVGGSSLVQYFRAGAAARIYGSHGAELSAIRIQDIFPEQGLRDPSNTVDVDGLILSYAGFAPQRGGGFPSVFSIGGGVVRHRTDGTGKGRETGAVQLGLEGDLWKPPVEWADVSTGLRVLIMPGSQGRQAYVIALTFGIRLG